MNRKVRLAIIIRRLFLPFPLVLVSFGLYSISFFIFARIIIMGRTILLFRFATVWGEEKWKRYRKIF